MGLPFSDSLTFSALSLAYLSDLIAFLVWLWDVSVKPPLVRFILSARKLIIFSISQNLSLVSFASMT